jgi:hypothetical protein
MPALLRGEGAGDHGKPQYRHLSPSFALLGFRQVTLIYIKVLSCRPLYSLVDKG